MIKILLYLTIPVCSALLIGSVVYSAADTLRNRTKMIDCSIAEFHPDFTSKMKEDCRNARNQIQNK